VAIFVIDRSSLCSAAKPAVKSLTESQVTRDGAIIFSDLFGKPDVVRLVCTKSERASGYHLNRLVENRGRDAKLIDWLDEITASCPKKIARDLNDPCGAWCPDLATVLWVH